MRSFILLLILIAPLAAQDVAPAPITGDEAAKILAQIKAEKEARSHKAEPSFGDEAKADPIGGALKIEDDASQLNAQAEMMRVIFYSHWLETADLTDVAVEPLGTDPRGSEIKQDKARRSLNRSLGILRNLKQDLVDNPNPGQGDRLMRDLEIKSCVRQFLGIDSDGKRMKPEHFDSAMLDLYFATRKH